MCDNYWHHVVTTYDGTRLVLYLDGKYENSGNLFGLMTPSSGPLNIGSLYADGATNASNPMLGRVDEAFITADVLSEEQVRNLYCVKIPHTLPTLPLRTSLNVHRRVRGAALAAADFPTPPLRLYNFSAGSLGDEGTNNQVLTNGNACVSVSGVDGNAGNAFAFDNGRTLFGTDAGLPNALATRSFGFWFKCITAPAAGYVLFSYGQTAGSTDERVSINSTGIGAQSGADNAQGPVLSPRWHFVTVVEENAPIDGVKRRLYIDGRVAATSNVLNPVTLGGAGHFRVGSNVDGSSMFQGQMDAVFVCDYALTPEQIIKLYTKSVVAYPPSPKSAGEHIEGIFSNNLLATFDTLEPQHTVDLSVA